MTQKTTPNFIDRHGTDFLRISLGVVFIWFGFLKFFDATSPAEIIAGDTISLLTFDSIKPNVSLPMLAVLECIIGIGLLTKGLMRYIIPLLYFQMIGAILPLLIFVDDCWNGLFIPTLLGQYIIKNSILISAAIVLGVVSKGGELIADPVVAEKAKTIENQKVEE